MKCYAIVCRYLVTFCCEIALDGVEIIANGSGCFVVCLVHMWRWPLMVLRLLLMEVVVVLCV